MGSFALAGGLAHPNDSVTPLQVMGLMVAENICGGATRDLWNVNPDYEAYQAASVSEMAREGVST